eukprot:NODE_1071_length_1128_cov_420.823911_g819_i0.p1 GENE.NODE_1071_length_1128_cov_420.823911_g819_i0~~NODE_1071_length_1128_cov_420.823911_g819_i0.p1  ORF type:complete len:313 (-),score=86.25 NODE_1071_length_1128_cov_420.823911_g819_i0:113-1051(-)
MAKISFKGDIRRVGIDFFSVTEFGELCQKLRVLHSANIPGLEVRNGAFALKYEDLEGDLVTIRTLNEFQEALSASGDVLRLFIEKKQPAKGSPCEDENLNEENKDSSNKGLSKEERVRRKQEKRACRQQEKLQKQEEKLRKKVERQAEKQMQNQVQASSSSSSSDSTGTGSSSSSSSSSSSESDDADRSKQVSDKREAKKLKKKEKLAAQAVKRQQKMERKAAQATKKEEKKQLQRQKQTQRMERKLDMQRAKAERKSAKHLKSVDSSANREQKVAQLHALGLEDKDLAMKLLDQNEGDIAAVVQLLLNDGL